MTPITTTSESEILTRVIAPERPTLQREVAEAFLMLRFEDDDRERMDDLAQKAQAGVLTPDERDAAENYERVGTFLALLKSKARQSLQHDQASNSA